MKFDRSAHLELLMYANTVFEIWNPVIWNFYPLQKTRRRNELRYRARGVVMHDRINRGEFNRLQKEIEK